MNTSSQTLSTPLILTANNTPRELSAPQAEPFQNPPAQLGIKPLVDIHGLRFSGIFPVGKEPCIRTLRRWTKGRVIPSHRVGRFVYYDLDKVAQHIHVKRLIPAR